MCILYFDEFQNISAHSHRSPRQGVKPNSADIITRTMALLSVSTTDSEPLRLDLRRRQASAVFGSRLLHFRGWFRAFADHSRFQASRSMSRPMLGNVAEYPFQRFVRDLVFCAPELPRCRNDVPCAGESDFSRLLFRHERRRRRQTSYEIVAEQRRPNFPLHVVRGQATHLVERQRVLQRPNVRFAVPSPVVGSGDLVSRILFLIEQGRYDFERLPFVLGVFDAIPNDADLHRLVEILFGTTVRKLSFRRSVPRRDEIAGVESSRRPVIDKTTAAHPHDHVDAAFLKERDGRERTVQGVHDDDVARLKKVEPRTKHRNFAGAFAGVIAVHEIENAAGRHRQDSDRPRDRHANAGLLVRMALEFLKIFRRTGQDEGRAVDDPDRPSEELPVFRSLLLQGPSKMSGKVAIDGAWDFVTGSDVAAGIDAGRLGADFDTISNGGGDGGVARLVGEKLPEEHPHDQQGRVDGMVSSAELALVLVEDRLNEFTGQDVVEGILAVLEKRVEKRRRGGMGELDSFFESESGMLRIQKALFVLLCANTVRRGRRMIVRRGLSVKTRWEINKKVRSCQWRFCAP